MAQTSINIRIDEELKKQFDEFCNNVGMTMTTAFCIFAKKTVKEQKIPFEISNDDFYSKSNIKYLEKVIQEIEEGKAKLEEHELIEEE